MHNWMKKAVTRLIAAFFGVVALLPNGKVLVPQIELLEEVTTVSEEIVYQVCNETGRRRPVAFPFSSPSVAI